MSGESDKTIKSKREEREGQMCQIDIPNNNILLNKLCNKYDCKKMRKEGLGKISTSALLSTALSISSLNLLTFSNNPTQNNEVMLFDINNNEMSVLKRELLKNKSKCFRRAEGIRCYINNNDTRKIKKSFIPLRLPADGSEKKSIPTGYKGKIRTMREGGRLRARGTSVSLNNVAPGRRKKNRLVINQNNNLIHQRKKKKEQRMSPLEGEDIPVGLTPAELSSSLPLLSQLPPPPSSSSISIIEPVEEYQGVTEEGKYEYPLPDVEVGSEALLFDFSDDHDRSCTPNSTKKLVDGHRIRVDDYQMPGCYHNETPTTSYNQQSGGKEVKNIEEVEGSGVFNINNSTINPVNSSMNINTTKVDRVNKNNVLSHNNNNNNININNHQEVEDQSVSVPWYVKLTRWFKNLKAPPVRQLKKKTSNKDGSYGSIGTSIDESYDSFGTSFDGSNKSFGKSINGSNKSIDTSIESITPSIEEEARRLNSLTTSQWLYKTYMDDKYPLGWYRDKASGVCTRIGTVTLY